MSRPPPVEILLLAYDQKRLELYDEEYKRIHARAAEGLVSVPPVQLAFRALASDLGASSPKHNLVPISFYLKYCFPVAKRSNMITIVDYGMGNLGSIQNMLKKKSVCPQRSRTTSRIARAGARIKSCCR